MTQDYVIGGVPHNAFDVDADGGFLYLAVKGTTTPQIIKMKSDLTANGVVVYNPGSGTEICLMAGDVSPYWIWATGSFGGTSKAILTQDGGQYWYTKNPSTWVGTARPILVGPGDDLLVTTSTGIILQQSYLFDDAIYWVSDESLRYPIYAIDRIDDNLDEIAVGTYWYTGLDESISYSPNEGTFFEDVSIAPPTNASVTAIILGRNK